MSPETVPAFSAVAQSIAVGSLYEHYKGHRYKIVGLARHSETLEELIVYQALQGPSDMVGTSISYVSRECRDKWTSAAEIQITSIYKLMESRWLIFCIFSPTKRRRGTLV